MSGRFRIAGTTQSALCPLEPPRPNRSFRGEQLFVFDSKKSFEINGLARRGESGVARRSNSGHLGASEGGELQGLFAPRWTLLRKTSGEHNSLFIQPVFWSG